MTKEFNPVLFGTRIKKLRENKRLSVVQLGKLAGLNKNTVCNVEGNLHKTSLDTAFKLANALGVDPVELMDPEAIEGIDYVVTRASDRKNTISVNQLSDDPEEATSAPLGNLSENILDISPEDGEQTICHHKEQFLFCLTGEILVTLQDKKEITLPEGASLLLAPGMSHTLKSTQDGNATGIIIMSEPENRTRRGPKPGTRRKKVTPDQRRTESEEPNP